jgi:hypothetical protein
MATVVESSTSTAVLVLKLQALDDHFAANPDDVYQYINGSGYVADLDLEDHHYSTKEIAAFPEGNRKTIFKLSDEIRGLVDEFLITDKGAMNYENMETLQQQGFYAVVTSRDSYGPLSAAVVGKHFRIGFG